MRIVLCNGCFDILHIGHVRHLAQAQGYGDRMIVSLTLDEHVNKGPGRPYNVWDDRAAVLRALVFVDEVIPSANAAEAIRAVRPQYYVKGIDYAGTEAIERDRIVCEEVGALLRLTTTEKTSYEQILKRKRSAT